eukprot:gnl/Trimastix_PCT/3668.p1 GENE.gnl/Trimastix_PCT/3668~~gnl/Trimastix_PCT/3668.p1  ORF type:complete len:193 (+),score=16.11 gnl/Trimastix_PCT/3668:78-656(+)
MGGNQSSALRTEDIEALEQSTNFSQREIKRLHKRFRKLDRTNTGCISEADFMQIPELAMNPLVHRVVTLFSTNRSSTTAQSVSQQGSRANAVDFFEFLHALSIFSPKAPKEDKLKFAFRVYDVDGDGFVSGDDLFEILQMMVGNSLTPQQLGQIVEKTVQEADLDGDGKLAYEEFIKVLDGMDLETKMTIQS